MMPMTTSSSTSVKPRRGDWVGMTWLLDLLARQIKYEHMFVKRFCQGRSARAQWPFMTRLTALIIACAALSLAPSRPTHAAEPTDRAAWLKEARFGVMNHYLE